MIEIDTVTFGCLMVMLAVSIFGVIALGNRAAHNRAEALKWQELYFGLMKTTYGPKDGQDGDAL